MNMQRYIKDTEVAEITGIAVQTLRNSRFLGQGFPYYKIGKSVRYKYSEILEHLERYRIETEAK